MAINKVIYGQNTIIDITDTTAVATDVASGKYFYLANGQKVSGTASGGASSGDVWQDEYGLVHLSDEPGTNVLVTPLSIISNGTYTAPSGTAYSPVTVDVPSTSVKYTATFVGDRGGRGPDTTIGGPCYVSHNGTVYTYASGHSFEFEAGDTLYCYTEGQYGRDITLIDNRVSTSVGTMVQGKIYYANEYNYVLPDRDITIELYYGSESYINITSNTPTISIITNGQYDVKSYDVANVSVPVNGITADDIAMRIVSGAIGGNATNIRAHAFRDCTSLTQANFALCTSIASYAFSSCTSLSQISFPVCISIGTYAFFGCTSLTQISFPACTSIAMAAFSGCTSLTQANFPSCTSIGTNAFYYCSSLSQISFPVCMSIGNNAFYGCASLTQANFPSCTSMGTSIFENCTSLTQADFPACSSIGAYAFNRCTSLSQISFPACTSIGACAFYSCTSLTQANFSSCTSMGTSTFYDCSLLTQANFPSCSSIGANAFYRCTSLFQISFPSCTSIGTNAFYGCTSLSQISFPVCTSIGAYAFYNCTSLSQISFPVCTSIGSQAFRHCSSLSQISFPVCTGISSYAFNDCNQLTTAIFSTTSATNIIHPQCFASCSRLISLYLLGSSLYVLSSTTTSTFLNTPILGNTTYTDGVLGSVLVPMSLYDTYISNAKWSDISSRFVSLTDAEVNNVLMYGRHNP